MLLLADYTERLVADPAVAFADSCAHDESGFMASLWHERQAFGDLLLDARPGRSAAFEFFASLESTHARLRARAKRTYHAARTELARIQRRA
jgi:hypothetical protein